MKVLSIIGIIFLALLLIMVMVLGGMVFGVYIVLECISDSPEKFAELIGDRLTSEKFSNLKENTIEVGKIISKKYPESGKKKVHKKLTEGKKKNDSIPKSKKSKDKR